MNELTDLLLCMTRGCHRPNAPAMKRGLCLVCYSKAKKMVEAGTTTWAELVNLGLAKPGEEDRSDPFTAAFNQAKKASQ